MTIVIRKIKEEHRFAPMLKAVRKLYALEHPDIFYKDNVTNNTSGGLH